MIFLSFRGLASAILTCVLILSAGAASAQQGPAAVTLFNNVRIFDGKSAALSAPTNVLVRGNLIERISQTPIAVDRSATTRIIDGGGRTLMPGLIDAHWHATMVRATPAIMLGSDLGYSTLLAGAEATATLMRGFTTIRDLGGPSFSLKRAIDEGVLPGPRIYPSGAVITVTSGHGDFRQTIDLPRTLGGMLSRVEQLGGAMIADSPDEVRLRAREQLMQGASQINLTGCLTIQPARRSTLDLYDACPDGPGSAPPSSRVCLNA
jgi:imidazolonepropionase-like amidohydrolase